MPDTCPLIPEPPPFSLARELEALQRAVAARDAAPPPPPPKPVPLRHRILAQVPQGMINALAPEAICARLEGISLHDTKNLLSQMFRAGQVKRIGRSHHFFYYK